MAEPSFDDILRLEAIDANLFHGATPPGAFVPRTVYGGQLVAQAMLAAGRTVDDKRCNSLHCYFLRAGDPAHPIAYEVERMRDGRSFATRRVTARQGGEQIMSLLASFKAPEPGPVQVEITAGGHLGGQSQPCPVRAVQQADQVAHGPSRLARPGRPACPVPARA